MVGVCTAIERAQWGHWDAIATLNALSYSRSVQRAGGIALQVPPDERAVEDPDPYLERLDALIVAGGADLDPASYGAEPDQRTVGTWPERDRFELALTRRALQRELPLLGICRGMQVLNVALGGTLVQHLPDVVGHEEHRRTAGAFGEHEVRLEPGSLAARAVGAESTTVKSHHHQGLDRIGDGLHASGWSVPDDVVEAVELPEQQFALGVLWHPEEDERSRVVGAVVEAVRTAVGAR